MSAIGTTIPYFSFQIASGTERKNSACCGIPVAQPKKFHRSQSKVKVIMILLTIKMVLLRLTKCQVLLLWLLHATKSLFIQYCAHKFENFGPKKLTVVGRYHTIMRAHIMHIPVINLFIDYAWETTHHPPYSPILSPPDSDLPLKLKEPPHGTQFGSLNEASLATTQEIRHLNKEWLLDGIQKLPSCWQTCIEKEIILNSCKFYFA